MLNNLQHEKFCRMYTMGPLLHEGRRIFLNATRAYMASYPKASYQTAQVNGARLKKRLKKHIDRLLDLRVAAYLWEKLCKIY